MAEQASQPQQPERAPKRHGLARKIAVVALSAGAAIGIPVTIAHNNSEARPAPATSSAAPEAPAATSAETAKPAATDIPEQLVKGREQLQTKATNAALSILEDMGRPNVGMTREGLDNFTIGNPSDEPNHAPEMLATYVPAENLIHIRSIVGNNGEGDAPDDKGAEVDLEFQVTNDNAIASKTDQLTTDDFRSAITDTTHTTLLSATAAAEGTWLRLSFDQHRVNAADEPNNVYVIDRVDEYDTFAHDLANTMKSAQDQLTAAAS